MEGRGRGKLSTFLCTSQPATTSLHLLHPHPTHRDMQENQYTPNVVLRNAFIEAYAHRGDIDSE